MLGGGGESMKSERSSIRSFVTSDSVRETTKLEVDSLKGNTFVNQYLILKNLGKGSHGKVKLCLNTDHNTLYAAKIVNKKKLRALGLGQKSRSRNRDGGQKPGNQGDPKEDMKREIVVMKKLDHPNVVKLFEVIDDPQTDKMILIMEYVNGGALMDGTISTTNMDPLSEDLARAHFRDVLKGLEYLHFNGIIHRDLKPENLLLTADGQVIISDFGCASYRVDGNDMMEDTCGTRPFFAPEMCSEDGRQYSGKKADIYAIGMCLYMFLYGGVPFSNCENVPELFETIRTKEVPFPEKDGQPLSPSLKHLLVRLLDKDPATRITLQDAMEHPWVTNDGSLPLMKTSMNMKLGHIDVSEEERTAALTPSIEVVFDSIPDMVERTYQEGACIVRKGVPTEGLFLIKDGLCEVIEKEDGEESSFGREFSVDLDFATNVDYDSLSESDTGSDSIDGDKEISSKQQRPDEGSERPLNIRKIGSLDKRHVKKHVLKTNTRTFMQMKDLVDRSFNDRAVNVSQRFGASRTIARGPGSILGILALNPDDKIPLGKETIVAVQKMKVSFVPHNALREFFKAQDSPLQVRLLLTKLQHVALMRDTVEKFAVLNSEMKEIEELRKVSRHKVNKPPDMAS